MKNKTKKPRTIAELKFNWEMTETQSYPSFEIALNSISEKNPNLKEYKIIPNIYSILVNDKTIIVDNTSHYYPTVLDFFEYLCFRCYTYYPPITGKFSHFERIDDRTYRIHMKS